MLAPKIVLVTGANRGIGLEFVKQFLLLKSPPKYIFACCRQPDTAEELKGVAKGNPSVHVLKLDVCDQSSIDNAKAFLESKVEGEGLNLLINNSAIISHADLYNATREDMAKVYETNAIGPLMVVKSFLPLLKKAASVDPSAAMSCNRAAIINISTGVASISENSSSGLYAYRASKAALNMITTNMSLDLKNEGILATAIHPGWVKTDMGGPNALIDTVTSVTGCMSVMEKLHGEEGTGKFYHGVRGDTIGW
ncbi:C-factor-like isoform X2 [Dreissena polymorpha]|uniref:C-factor-like isoform X1 n=1 Tax=Dreissena polymorpha TaxID=45954 RepID=UPI002263AC15|nr:C-factor-like isoform X1 [Dreissena polymorpha]XP_052283223.1 C-factor-like isoform X2 [Dreissena polymorpha]